MKRARRTKRAHAELHDNPRRLFPTVNTTLWPNGEQEIWFTDPPNGESLHVYRENCSHSPRRHNWRLAWARPGDSIMVNDVGECDSDSRKYFRTLADARAYGVRHYGETAIRRTDWD